MELNKTVAELARLVDGQVQGDGSSLIAGAAGISEAGPRDISFVGNPKYAQAAASSKAGCVLLPSTNRNIPCGAKSRIYVDDPQYAFSQVLVLIAGQKPKPAPVLDGRAAIHPEARLGPQVS